MVRYNTSIAHFCSQIMASVEYMNTTPNDTSWLPCQQNDPIGWEPTISLTSMYGMKTTPASVAHWEHKECLHTLLRSNSKYSSRSVFRGLRSIGIRSRSIDTSVNLVTQGDRGRKETLNFNVAKKKKKRAKLHGFDFKNRKNVFTRTLFSHMYKQKQTTKLVKFISYK